MYYYIVDAGKLNQREYERVQQHLYSSISEYHISGEIVRVTGVRTVKQLVETAFFHQAKTIVAVGLDETLNEIINVVGERETTIGYIPLRTTKLSQTLGLPDIPQACKFLALRRIEQMDLGVINQQYFLSGINLGFDFTLKSKFDLMGLNLSKELSEKPPIQIKFKVDDTFEGTAEIISALILNSRFDGGGQIGDPTDEKLDLLLLPKLSFKDLLMHRNKILNGEYEKIPNSSIIHFQHLKILSPENLSIKIGDLPLAETPADISVIPKKVRIIVGKDRKF